MFVGSFYLLLFWLIIYCTLVWYIKISLLLIVLRTGQQHYKRQFDPDSVERIRTFWQNPDGYWRLQTNQQTLYAELLPRHFVTQFLIIMNFRTEESQKISLALLPGNIGAENYRRLLVQLYHFR